MSLEQGYESPKNTDESYISCNKCYKELIENIVKYNNKSYCISCFKNSIKSCDVCNEDCIDCNNIDVCDSCRGTLVLSKAEKELILKNRKRKK